jgi:hypothetical protein
MISGLPRPPHRPWSGPRGHLKGGLARRPGNVRLLAGCPQPGAVLALGEWFQRRLIGAPHPLGGRRRAIDGRHQSPRHLHLLERRAPSVPEQTIVTAFSARIASSTARRFSRDPTTTRRAGDDTATIANEPFVVASASSLPPSAVVATAAGELPNSKSGTRTESRSPAKHAAVRSQIERGRHRTAAEHPRSNGPCSSPVATSGGRGH